VLAAAIDGANDGPAQRPPLGGLEPAEQRAVQQVDGLDPFADDCAAKPSRGAFDFR
jgi:hypothetical protein